MTSKEKSGRIVWVELSALLTLLALLMLFVLLASRSAAQTPTKSRQLGRPTDSVKSWPIKTKRWALVVGVDQYRDAQINALKGSVNDAHNLANALVRYAGFPKDQVLVLTTDQPEERQPTRINILTYLSNLASLVPKDGLLLVSFAGHGIEREGQAFLIPSDARLSRDISLLEESAVSVVRMRDRIKAIGVRQVIVLLDACRNDPGGRAGAPNNMSAAYAKFDFDVRNREVEAFATIYATAIGQRAYEYTEKRQGYFTWAIVEALKGGAANEKREITLSALVKYIQHNVLKRTAIDLGAHEQQKPFAIIEGYRADDLIIAMAEPWVGSANTASSGGTLEPTPVAAPPAASNSPVANVPAHMSLQLDLPTALALLDRAIKAKDGSQQGQVGAIEELLRRGFVYKNASFDGVSLAGGIMHGADFSSSSFVDGDLSRAEFNRGKLEAANLNFATLKNTSFREVNASEALIQYADAESANFDGATLNRSSFLLSRLTGASFRNAKLRGACLAFCDLTGADFTGADLTDAIIYSSVLDGAKFDKAVINNTDVGSSVANNISFTAEQRNELRRSSPLVNDLDLKIWGHARHTGKWSASYPDFNSFYTKLKDIPYSLRGSLRFRNAEALQPVGPFRTYKRDGPNDIRANYWFDAEFWEQGNRAKRLKGRLEEYGAFLSDQISRQVFIEGSGLELKALIAFIDKNSQVVSYSGPLIWTNDAYTTLLLSAGLISTKDMDEHEWASLALGRCEQDATRTADSWQPMYPPSAKCDMLPSTHVESYKKWTLARSTNLRARQLEVVYAIRPYDLKEAQRLADAGNSSRERILVFDNLQRRNEKYLNDSMFDKRWTYENQEFLLGVPTIANKRYPLLKLPATRSRYSIAMSRGQTLPHQTGKSLDDTYFQFRVVFDLSGITINDARIYEFAVTPRKAKIEVEGKTIWEGTIDLKIEPGAEVSYWETIKASQDSEDFKAYLEAYPQGQFSAVANKKLGSLQGIAKPWLDGVWEGVAYQTNSRTTWTIKLTVQNNIYLIEYPSLSCGGRWTLINKSFDVAKFKEKITQGVGRCSDDGNIIIERHGDSRIAFKYAERNSTMVVAATMLDKK